MASAETIEANEASVVCDGEGVQGHPRVFLRIGDTGEVDCPYCGRRFVLKARAGEAAGP